MAEDDFAQTTLLLQAARAGDAAAQERLFATLLPRVRRIVAARMGKRVRELADVDDLVQDTLLDLFTGLEHTPPATLGRFHLWLARCVERNIIDCARGAAAQRRGGDRQRRFADLARSSAVGAIAAGGRSPASDAGAGELDHRLEEALLGLRREHRDVVVLRVLCDLSFAEIAGEFGHDDADLARAWFSRALAALRERLGGHELAFGAGHAT